MSEDLKFVCRNRGILSLHRTKSMGGNGDTTVGAHIVLAFVHFQCDPD